MGIVRGAVTVAMCALLLPGCDLKKGEGERCKHSSECEGTLVCERGPVMAGSMGQTPPKTCRSANLDGATCTCGCDHSETFIEELRGMDPARAERVIAEKLAVIDAQERAGRLTPKMAAHRRRLEALRKQAR